MYLFIYHVDLQCLNLLLHMHYENVLFIIFIMLIKDDCSYQKYLSCFYSCYINKGGDFILIWYNQTTNSPDFCNELNNDKTL